MLKKPAFTSTFEISLTQAQHGIIANYAVQRGMMMQDALKELLNASLFELGRKMPAREVHHG